MYTQWMGEYQNVGVKCNSLHINETNKNPQFSCNIADFQLIEERKMPDTATLKSTRIVLSDYNNTTIIINNHITNTNNSLIFSIIGAVVSTVSAIATVVLAIVAIKTYRKNSYNVNRSNLQQESSTDAAYHSTIHGPIEEEDEEEEDQANTSLDNELRVSNTRDIGISNDDSGHVSANVHEQEMDTISQQIADDT